MCRPGGRELKLKLKYGGNHTRKKRVEKKRKILFIFQIKSRKKRVKEKKQ